MERITRERHRGFPCRKKAHFEFIATAAPTSKPTTKPTPKPTPKPTTPPPTPTSLCGTLVAVNSGNSIVDANQNVWSIASGGQVPKEKKR